MSELRTFLAMGGYAAYVWSAYAVAAVVLGGIVAWSALEHRRVRRETLRRAGALARERARRGRP